MIFELEESGDPERPDEGRGRRRRRRQRRQPHDRGPARRASSSSRSTPTRRRSRSSKSDIKIQIGRKLTRGLGAGARPEIGRQAIEENRDEVAAGGAGRRHGLHHLRHGRRHRHRRGAGDRRRWRARPGALTVGIVTKPFLFEGRKRMQQAEQGIAEMRKNVDTMIVVPNERLLAVVGKGIPFQDALKKADEVLLHATQGIAA